MSSDKKHPDNHKGYRTPSFAVDLFATLAGLALVYGMITLVGNGRGGEQVVAAPVMEQSNVSKSGASPVAIGDLKDYTRGKLAAFFIYKQPKPIADFTFVDEKGQDHSLKELRGKVVLLNLWATWCGPCRHEMPWLDTIKDKFKGRPFEMLTISVDRGGLKKPRRFFNKINIKHLTLYGDKSGRLSAKLRAFGLPTTLLIDRQGRELGRIAGPAEWASQDAFDFIEAAILTTGNQKK